MVHPVDLVLALDVGLDIAVLRLANAVDIAPVRLMDDGAATSLDVYVAGHPAGRPLTAVLGRTVAHFESIDFEYISGTKTKTDVVLYWADAAPGSSGSPVFDHHTHAVVALHHSGGLSATDLGVLEQADGFNELLAGTSGTAIIEFLESHDIEFERVQ